MHNSKRLFFSGLFFSAWLMGCLLCSHAVVSADDKPARPAHVFLWKVTSPQGTAYLLGSIHIAKASIYPLDDRIENAFAASDSLVVEVNMSAEQLAAHIAKMQAKGVYPPDDSLDKHIAPESLQLVNERATQIGVSYDKLLHFKPWFASILLSLIAQQKLGIQSEYGIDHHFEKLAEERKKKILELESAERQLQLFDEFTDQEHDLLLVKTLKGLDVEGKRMEKITTAWSNGDPAALDALLNDEKQSPETEKLMQKVFVDRNKEMAAKLGEMLKQKQTYFVVVGAGHMVGKNGLVSLLGKDFKVEQM